MRLLILEHSPAFVGGSERMSLALARHFRGRGHSVTLLHAEFGDMVPAYAQAEIETICRPVAPLAVRKPLGALRSIHTLLSVVSEHGIELIFTSQVSYASLLAAASTLCGVRTAVHLGLLYDFQSPLFRRSLPRIDLGIAPSAHTAAGWEQRGWPRKNLRVIPNGVDLSTFSPAENRATARASLGLPDDDQPLIAYVGRLVREKGIFTLLKAFALWRNRGGRGRLLFVGRAPGNEIEDLKSAAREQGLPEVAWCLRKATPTPEAYYRAADVVVVPSEWNEPFGLAPLEAMACGTLVIVSDRGILPDLVAPQGADCVFPAGDAAALAGRLENWLTDANRRETAARSLLANTRDRYAFARCGDSYLDAFASIPPRRK